MKKEEIIGNIMEKAGEGKKLPSSLEQDLSDCAQQLERAKGSGEQVDEVMENDRFRRLRDRIKGGSNLEAAQEFERCIEELKK